LEDWAAALEESDRRPDRMADRRRLERKRRGVHSDEGLEGSKHFRS
jgi:hypothetical protein